MLSNDDAVDVVRRDIEIGFEQVLPGRTETPFRLHQAFADVELRPITNFVEGQDAELNSIQVVPWEYTGANIGALLGIPPGSGQPPELTIEGVTLLETDPAGNVVNMTRFVDWGKTLAELQVQVYTRPVVDVRQRFPESFMQVPELRRLVEEGIVDPPTGLASDAS